MIHDIIQKNPGILTLFKLDWINNTVYSTELLVTQNTEPSRGCCCPANLHFVVLSDGDGIHT